MGVVHCTSMTNRTIVAFDNTVKLGSILAESVIQKIDQEHRDIQRSRFIRRAVKSYLSKAMSKK